MGLFAGAGKLGLAKKAVDEARKPQNQARLKSALAKVQQRRKGGGTGTQPGPRA